ncbi:c-type cytochrome [Novosphingobium sp. FSY-8]|uniref:C-type cytochrome n=1 Tax=Novosphingobium ovatum TaxID=1908523 RepID=A0ABW9XG86_9SPHN|nr:c-type cytochrome [Novosphingobium ovatum]NBC37557.1 c-type cytochrome [Novosphingobium ovatum]
MSGRFNTIAGWVLGSGIVALGLASLSGHYFRADKEGRPETMGYSIAGVSAEGAGAAAEPSIEALLAKADPAKGEQVFQKCAACHTATQGGANGVGPNLYGVMGEEIGKGRAGFAFSAALSGKGGKWDFASMNDWLKNPRGFADGTKMTFAGLESAEDRANVMVYLNKLGSNLPLPAVPAAPAAGAAPAAVAVVGDAAKGQTAFAKCAACHTITPGGANGVGPNLAKVVGRDVAKAAGFSYSADLAKLGGKWDEALLDKWLTSPRAMASGTKMTFAGIENPQERADIIAYLKAN